MSEPQSVIVERDFPHPPEKVWRALTQPHLIEEWLMKADFKPVVGHRFDFRVNPRPDVDFLIHCQILAVEPHKKLSYTWNRDEDASGMPTVVTFTLTPTASGTHLRMEHAGFSHDRPQNYRGAIAGWHRFLGALEKVLGRMD